MRVVKIKERANRVAKASIVNGKTHKWVATECEKLVTLELTVDEIRKLKTALDLHRPRGRVPDYYHERDRIQTPVFQLIKDLPSY